MTYTLNIFAELIAEYPSYNDLAAHLRSEAGGKVQIIENAEDNLAIFHYDKKQTDMGRWSWMRSVVWDMATNRPVAVAPPKATEVNDTFMGGSAVGMQIQDYLEGTTLNVYRGVQIASRTKFGASKGYYSPKSFSDMLADALGDKSISTLVPEGYTFASVLLQHPEHRVVEEVKEPRVWILHAGRVEADGTVIIDEAVAGAPATLDGPGASNTVSEWFAGLASANSWTWRGAVLKDGAGARYRLKSNSYHMVRSLRGSTARADERFLGLRAAGLVKTYLYYYPEDKQLYWRYETGLRAITNDLYAAYCAVFKEKSMALAEADPKLQVHVRGLHAQYLGSLRPAGKTVVRSTAIQYINSQPIPRLLHLLNVDKRAARSVPVLPVVADSVLA